MDCELVGSGSTDYIRSYSEKFEEYCPYLMSMGMTYEQYWDGDSVLARYYLKADRLNRERMNQQLWLQGRYIYEAILCASPALNPLVKDHTPLPYMDEPIPIDAKTAQERKERAEKQKFEKVMAGMRAWANTVNKNH